MAKAKAAPKAPKADDQVTPDTEQVNDEAAVNEQQPKQKKADDGLIPIKKFNEPNLRVHPDALDQHLKLGWEIIN